MRARLRQPANICVSYCSSVPCRPEHRQWAKGQRDGQWWKGRVQGEGRPGEAAKVKGAVQWAVPVQTKRCCLRRRNQRGQVRAVVRCAQLEGWGARSRGSPRRDRRPVQGQRQGWGSHCYRDKRGAVTRRRTAHQHAAPKGAPTQCPGRCANAHTTSARGQGLDSARPTDPAP